MRHIRAFAAAIVLASPASGHHSDAALDMNSLVTFEGTVTGFNWRNPHVYFTVETMDEHGEQTEWTLQMGSTISSTRLGWTPESLSIGDRVTVRAHPARNGRPYALSNSLQKEGGIALTAAFNDDFRVLDNDTQEARLAEPEVTASTSTLEGRWMADTSKLVDYLGGFSGFFQDQLTLTEKGKTAQATFNEHSAENPIVECIGRPTPSMIVTTNYYPLEIQINEDDDTIVIRTQYFDEERTVYMDAREHPEANERTFSGHSIGRWEGDTLVVDTKNFADHRSPYQNGIPSGSQKHVVERYTLTEDGTQMVVEFMLEDPEYILEPMTHTRELIYSPQADMSQFNCDLESTRRFLPQGPVL